MNYDLDRDIARQIAAKRALLDKGWISLGAWIFISPSGTWHDLSAADLTQLDRIEREGLFVV